MSGQNGSNPVKKDFTARTVPCSARPLLFDESLCIGCNRCVEHCQVDILLPNRERGKPPHVVYPGECYYCGCCVMACPQKGAIRLQHPLMNRAKFVESRRPGSAPAAPPGLSPDKS